MPVLGATLYMIYCFPISIRRPS